MYADPTLNAGPRAEQEEEVAYHPLAAVLAAAIAGILADRYGSVALSAWIAAALVSLGLWFLLYRLGRDVRCARVQVAHPAGRC